MAHCYKFAIIRLAPEDARGERLNIGAVILDEDSIDIRISKRLDKIKAISSAIDTTTITELVENLKGLDAHFRSEGIDDDARIKMISRVGPLSLSNSGSFVANDFNSYEDRIASVLKAMVDPEPASPVHREKRTKLFTQVKSAFKQEKVLAKKDETLDSHRIVPSYEIDEGLIADLVLRNGAMHVVETFDASVEAGAFHRAISGIGISTLVFERARMRFGGLNTKARLVYSASSSTERMAQPCLEVAAHQGAQLTNWASADQRAKFIHDLASLATPSVRKKQDRPTQFASLLKV